MKSEVQKAIKVAGSKEQLATLCRVTGRTIDHWLEKGRVSRSAARLLEIETQGQVTEERLRR